MNKHQKKILLNLFAVLGITFIMVVAMVNFKDYVNRSEAMLAMDQIGKFALGYRNDKGHLPPEKFFYEVREKVQGAPRLQNLVYRARWIGIDAKPDEILAYAQKNYNSLLLGNGYVVLRLSGQIEWMKKNEFENLLEKQQTTFEAELTK